MHNPLEYYKEHSETYKAKAKACYKLMTSLSLLRLLVFVLTGFGVYLTFDAWQLAVAIALLGTVVFVKLLSRYTDIKHNKAFNDALTEINSDEIKIASGDFYDREKGLQFQDPAHFYSLDIDLFGRGSFFQFVNRTNIKEGAETLASMLKANNIEDITARQKAIKELSEKPKWRQYYGATSSLVDVETPAREIIDWLRKYQTFLSNIMRWLPLAFIVATIIILGLTLANVIEATFLMYWLFVGLAITGPYVKKINILSLQTDKLKDTFRQYAQLLKLIEEETFTSEFLRKKQSQIKSESKEASAIFKALSRALDALDNRNNIIGAIFGNGYFLTDIRNSYRIEKWIESYGDKVEDWFEVVSFFDAYNSLGNYAYNHPGFIYPEISEKDNVIKAKGLGHPLLDKTKRVDSDLLIENEQFFIVTGANMAGKSTFLRTVSLHIVMANMGLPICAKHSQYSPVKLITSMRTTDSLTDDSSYFFSELKRLKFIVDTIAKEPYFIILDEILKGTNSTDKAIGSKKFVEKLVASNATGVIATHDLSLCEIEEQLEAVKNYYFDAEIINNELHFDYKLKKGICQNMNASFLLKKMEIV
ncbi:DNA mismatch repair protein MutS [Seonamhaeicola sp. ML3]|uniref:MutS-related protein n=1 Tax=Seonamhaeicola sp. ML3 TaxID=2937786 RepID=UPI00200C3090|nr:DNA mismatch repair protein MutS [Seonamhaeicola sp. ML3]